MLHAEGECLCKREREGGILASPWLTLVHPFSLVPPCMSLLLNMCAAVSWQVFVWVCVVCACIHAVWTKIIFHISIFFFFLPEEKDCNYTIPRQWLCFPLNFTYNKHHSVTEYESYKGWLNLQNMWAELYCSRWKSYDKSIFFFDFVITTNWLL